jgi:hypothetical protein
LNVGLEAKSSEINEETKTTDDNKTIEDAKYVGEIVEQKVDT